jgi:arylsulfatase A-like enzyme
VPACESPAPKPEAAGFQPPPVVSAPQHLVEVVRAEHFHTRASPPPAHHTTTDRFEEGLNAWSTEQDDAGTLADGMGRDGSTALVMGPGAERRSAFVSRTVEVSGPQHCTVGVWLRTEDLKGNSVLSGARMEVMEQLASSGSKKKRKRGKLQSGLEGQSYRHLPHVAGTTDWTHQELELDLDPKATALEVRLTAGHSAEVYLGGTFVQGLPGSTRTGTALFDDLTVDCVAPSFPEGPDSNVWKAADNSVARRVSIQDDNRPAIVSGQTDTWVSRVDRSTAQTLTTAVGLADGTHRKAKVCFAISVDGQKEKEVCRRGGAGEDRRWKTISVDLPALPGTTSTVEFRTHVTSKKHARPTLAAWADPTLESTEPPTTPRPNILVILIDTLRADSIYALSGRREGTSPALDAFARAATVYTAARSPTSWTLPSSATLLTGMHPLQHGAGWRMRRGGRTQRPTTDFERSLHYSGIVDGTPRMAAMLRDAGYSTRGWYSNHYLDPRFGTATGFSRWESFRGSDWLGAARAVKHVQRSLKSQRTDDPGPWFLFVHVIDPHLPYLARDPIPAPFTLPDSLPLEPLASTKRPGMTLTSTSGVGPDHAEAVHELYDIDVHYVDQMVGRIIDLVPEDTLVVVTSDHGEAFAEHGAYQHGASLYDEVLRVPLLVRWPDGSHAGARIETPVSLADATATVLDAAGIDVSALDGRPLPKPGQPPSPRPMFYSHVYNGPDLVGVLDGTHKLVRRLPDGGLDPLVRVRRVTDGLFDLSADPLEQHDLTAEAPEVYARLNALLEERIDAAIPGTHVKCAAPTPTLTFTSDQPFVRAVPLSSPEVEPSVDRRTLTVAASPDSVVRLILEARDAAGVQVEPADACTTWSVAIPDMEVTLDQSQVENLRAIGYME